LIFRFERQRRRLAITSFGNGGLNVLNPGMTNAPPNEGSILLIGQLTEDQIFILRSLQLQPPKQG
jgi:hypothetical protein